MDYLKLCCNLHAELTEIRFGRRQSLREIESAVATFDGDCSQQGYSLGHCADGAGGQRTDQGNERGLERNVVVGIVRLAE